MFKDNKYTRTYYQIIDRAKNRINEGYIEKHHIIPKSCDGSNNENNLVELTSREHFLCHWLLTKMTEGKQLRNMNCAFKFMSKHGKNERLIRIAKTTGATWTDESKQKLSRTLKEEYATGKRIPVKGMLGKNLTSEQKAKISVTHKGKPKSTTHKEKLRQYWKGKTWKLVDGKRVWMEVY